MSRDASRAFFRRRPFLPLSPPPITLDSLFPSTNHPQTIQNNPQTTLDHLVVAAMFSLNLFESIAAFFRPETQEGAPCSSPASSSSKSCANPPAVSQLQPKQEAIKPVLCRRYVYFNARAQKSQSSTSTTTSSTATTTVATTASTTETATTTSRSLLRQDRGIPQSVHR